MTPLFLLATLSIPGIALANILWGILLIVTLYRREKFPVEWPWIFLTAYILASLASVATSYQPLESLAASKDLFNFLVFPLAAVWVTRARVSSLQVVFALQAVILSLWGFAQYFYVVSDQPAWRIRGPLSHYMTFAGLLVILILINLITLIRGRGTLLRIAALLALILSTTAVILSLTRNAWVGLAMGFIVLAVAMKRLTGLIILALFLLILLLPGPHRERVRSFADLTDPSNNDRLAMLSSGWEMFKDFPIMGVGPDQARHIYPFYRENWSTRPRIPHLHNNIVQIAAERGVAGLLAYAAFVASVLSLGWRRRSTWGGLATLVTVAAITTAGLFEWNFGDTEVLMLTLVASTLYLTKE